MKHNLLRIAAWLVFIISLIYLILFTISLAGVQIVNNPGTNYIFAIISIIIAAILGYELIFTK